MMLSHSELMEIVEAGVIDALPENVGASSIDVRLGHDFLVEKRQPGWDLNIDIENITSPMVNAAKTLTGDVVLTPGAFVLAHTIETFNMPHNLSAEFRLRSSMARIGLEHSLAAWIDPGFHGSNLTLELRNNLQHHNIILKPGVRIGQIIFHRHSCVNELASYKNRGRYNNSLGAVGAK